MDFAELIVDVKQRQTIQSLNKIEGKLNSLEKNAKNVGVAFLAGWSFTKIIGMLDGFGRSLQARNVAARQFGVIFSGSMNLASASVRRLQGELSKTETQARNMMAVIGAKIPEIGFNSETITKISTDIAVLAENTAAAMGKNVDEVINKFTNALAGQTKGLRDVGIYVDKNSESFKTQAAELEKSLGLTQKQAEVMATLNQMLESGNKFTGAAKENINTITGALENLKNTFNDIVGSKVGQIFSAIFAPALNILSAILKIPMVAWITAISIATTAVFGAWKAISFTIQKLISPAVGGILENIHEGSSNMLKAYNISKALGEDWKDNYDIQLKKIQAEKEEIAILNYRNELQRKYLAMQIDPAKAAQTADIVADAMKKRGKDVGNVIQNWMNTYLDKLPKVLKMRLGLGTPENLSNFKDYFSKNFGFTGVPVSKKSNLNFGSQAWPSKLDQSISRFFTLFGRKINERPSIEGLSPRWSDQSYFSKRTARRLAIPRNEAGQLAQQIMQAISLKLGMIMPEWGGKIGSIFENFGNLMYIKASKGNVIAQSLSIGIINFTKSMSSLSAKFGKWSDSIVEGIIKIFSVKIGGNTAGSALAEAASAAAGTAAGASIGLGAKIGAFFKGLAKNLIKWIGVGLAAMFKLVWTGLTLAVKGIWSVVSSTAFAFVTVITAAATAIIFAVDAIYTVATTDLDPIEVWSYLMQPLADWWEGTEQAKQEAKKHAEYANAKIKEWQTIRKTQLEPVLRSYARFLRDVVNVKDFKEVVNNRKINDLQVTRQQYLKYMEQLRRTIDDGPAGVFNEDERMKARQEAAEKLKTAMQNYSKIQKQIEQLENDNYSMRNKWYNDRLGEEENFRKQSEDIFKEMSTTAQQRNLRIKHLQQELAKMSEATLQKVYGGTWGKGANMKPEDRIALYRKQEAIITQEAKLRIEALKEEYEITKNMRGFISDMMKKMLEFKSTTVDAIQANTVEGQKFASSRVGNINLQQSLLNQNYAEQKSLQTRILYIQNSTYQQLVKINANIVSIMNKNAGFRVCNNLI